MMDYGLSPDEARELQAQLDADEWEALLQVQRQLLDAPMAAPSAAFANRVLAQVVARERQQARRRNVIGSLVLALGSLTFTGLMIWNSPLGTLMQVGGWAVLLDSALSLFGLSATLLSIGRTFVETLVTATGGISLLLFALFALALTLIWTRVASGNAPLSEDNL
jgi:hypothetical protein